MPGGLKDFPKHRPEILIQGIGPGIARHNGATISPCLWSCHQPGADRIVQNIETDFCESPVFPFFLTQDMVVGLGLQPMGKQPRLELRAQKRHSISLVRIAAQAQPEQMNVVGHQTISWAKQPLASGNVKQ
jgi:hypothetical protein